MFKLKVGWLLCLRACFCTRFFLHTDIETVSAYFDRCQVFHSFNRQGNLCISYCISCTVMRALKASLCLGKQGNEELCNIFHVFDSCVQSRNIHCCCKEALSVCLWTCAGWKVGKDLRVWNINISFCRGRTWLSISGRWYCFVDHTKGAWFFKPPRAHSYIFLAWHMRAMVKRFPKSRVMLV